MGAGSRCPCTWTERRCSGRTCTAKAEAVAGGRGESLPGGVWHVAREFAGLAEAGGLKDAVAGLAAAQVRAGIRAAVLLPRYGFLVPLEAERLPVRFSL